MKYLSFFAFALLLLSCNSQPNTNETTDMTPMTDQETPMTDQEMPMPAGQDSPLQPTIDAVQSTGGDITALPPDAAVTNIDSWISKLQSMDGTSGIVDNLQMLKSELTAGNIDGSKVSNLLSTLATQTREVGQGNAGLNTLASALDAGAQKLAGK